MPTTAGGGGGGYCYDLGQLDGCLTLKTKLSFNLAMEPLCSTNDDAGGEVLMVKDRKKIVVYSPKNKDYRRIHTDPSALHSISIKVAEYVESLVSPNAATRPNLTER
ncbi:hypothetical protein LguiB_026202 [Lonicera macranthoides]